MALKIYSPIIPSLPIFLHIYGGAPRRQLCGLPGTLLPQNLPDAPMDVDHADNHWRCGTRVNEQGAPIDAGMPGATRKNLATSRARI
jgi:hypothetical protein